MRSSHYYRSWAAVVLLITSLSIFVFFSYTVSNKSVPVCEIFGYGIEQKICDDKCLDKLCPLKCFDGYIDLIRNDNYRTTTSKLFVITNQTNKTQIFRDLESQFPIGSLAKCDNLQQSFLSDGPEYQYHTTNVIALHILFVLIPFIFIAAIFYYCFMKNRYSSKHRYGSPNIYKRI